MRDGLKECPFCGSEEIRVIDRINVSNGLNSYYHVKCRGCGASSDEYKSQYDAIMAWNRRK